MENNKKILGLEMNLDQEYLKGAVEDIVKAGITQALGDPSEMIAMAINQIINMSVDPDGKPVANSSYRAQPYLKWYAEQAIKQTVKECLEKVIEENKAGFEEEVTKQLSSKKFREASAGAFIKTMMSESTNQYRMPISVTFELDKNY